jgi:hypothetical protein
VKPLHAVSKPKKQDVDLKSIKTLSELPCQKIHSFISNRTLRIPDAFNVDEKLFSSPKNLKHQETIEFVISCLKSALPSNQNKTLPTWAGIQALLSTAKIPIMQVAFLPFIPRPVTDPSTVYTAMLNFVKVANQLEQKSLPLFCDEGVFRIVVDIILIRPIEF